MAGFIKLVKNVYYDPFKWYVIIIFFFIFYIT